MNIDDLIRECGYNPEETYTIAQLSEKLASTIQRASGDRYSYIAASIASLLSVSNANSLDYQDICKFVRIFEEKEIKNHGKRN